MITIELKLKGVVNEIDWQVFHIVVNQITNLESLVVEVITVRMIVWPPRKIDSPNEDLILPHLFLTAHYVVIKVFV